MSAIHEAVSWGLSQVSVTARISIVFEIIRSVREAVLSRMERMLVVARRMLCLTTGPRFRFTSPASSRINDNLNVDVERGIGSNFRLKQRLRHGRLCRYVKDSCVLIYFEGVEMTSDQCASLLHKVKSWLLEAAEQHNNKTLNKNSGDI